MKHVLITGGTGCIGANLAVALRERSIACRVLRRPQSKLAALEGVDVEFVSGDVRDNDSLLRAMAGCDTVFHTAAIVSFWKPLRQTQYDVNVTGTRNVVEAALAAGVRRLVHTSSVAAIGYRTDGRLIDEDTAYNWGPDVGYKYSKHLAELEVLKGVSGGLDAVIVNPSVVIGPRDVYIHGGQFVLDMARRRIPVYLDGGLNVVAVCDVAEGHIAAAERGRTGERYILAGTNFTHKDFFHLLARTLGVPPPRLRCPVPVVKTVARACDLYGELFRRQPWITSELTSGAGMRNWYSSAKAESELGYLPSPVVAAINETASWYREHGML